MAEFSEQARRRDRRRWPYAHLLSDTDGGLMIETLHGSEASLRAEVQVSAGRIARGEPNAGGRVPGRIDVDGLADADWQRWVS